MKEFLGIELGSTRIKAVVIDGRGGVLAKGAYAWENRPLSNGIWTYDLDEALAGVASAYSACAADYAARHGERPRTFAAIGISAMMHGYLAFDAAGRLLAPFRTWRSVNAARAEEELSKLFSFHLPMRWSAAQLYQSWADREPHVKEVAFLTTLAGYVHWRLTGRKVLGVDDASGMFPIDAATGSYDARMAAAFGKRTGVDVAAVFPEVLSAGEDAGALTEDGAKLLDPSGTLFAGIPLCPPEGDGGTGMVATNAVRTGTGNVSAGTSVFAMVVTGRRPGVPRPELDVVSTPAGDDVVMVHSNNGCGELDRYVALFGGDYAALFAEAMRDGEPDCGGVRATNWIAAEPLLGVMVPGPKLTHLPGARLTRANVMRAQLYAVFAALKAGMSGLEAEGAQVRQLTGHGGVFTVPKVAQQVLADALNVPVACLKTAGEGGAWGIAALAAYREHVRAGGDLALADFLDREMFASVESSVLRPDSDGIRGFNRFVEETA